MTKEKKTIALTTSSFGVYDSTPVSLLEKAGFEVRENPYGRKLTPEEVAEMYAGCVGVVSGTEVVSREVMELLPGLKVISRCGVGMDGIDLPAAEDLGIRVVNTPFGPTQATAEMAVGLMFTVLRQIAAMDRDMRAGVWKKRMGRQLSGKKVGILGLGRIGGRVAIMLQGMGCRVAFHDPMLCATESPFEAMPLDDLLQWAEIVTVHCSGQCDCSAVLGRDELERLSPGAMVINCARGELVDEEALVDLIESGHLGGAGLDVYSQEPYKGRLLEFDNVVLTPHASSYSMEGRITMELDAVKNLLSTLEGL